MCTCVCVCACEICKKFKNRIIDMKPQTRIFFAFYPMTDKYF